MINKFPYKVIDLTHEIHENIPCWTGGCGFTSQITVDYADCPDDVKFRVNKLSMNAGIGTHIDAPAHCNPNGLSIAAIPLEQLIVPCVCIDVSNKANEQYQVSIDDILEFEQQHGKIAENSFVILYTGWEQHWHNPDRYRNNYNFPSVSLKAAQLLLERNIAGIGIDTLSPDTPQSKFVVHQLLLSAQKYIVENVAHAHKLPAKNSFAMIMPIKAAGVTEAPIRLLALIEQ